MPFVVPAGQAMWKAKVRFEYPEGSGKWIEAGKKVCHINFKDEARLIEEGKLGPRKPIIRGAADRVKSLGPNDEPPELVVRKK